MLRLLFAVAAAAAVRAVQEEAADAMFLDDRCKNPTSFCGGSTNPENERSCTPFNFRPGVQTPQCQHDLTDANLARLTGGRDDARGWAYFGSGDRNNYFVIHGCDGAGIQTDCMGDILYIEQFGPINSQGPQCDYDAQYPSHNSCDFHHPGTHTDYSYYMSGWWNFGDLAGKDWLLGPNTPYNWAGEMQATLNANNLQHNPYTNADIRLVATISPWTCSYDSDPNMRPFTGTTRNCYSDNEPWNGRGGVDAGQAPEPNWNQKLIYCGLYQDAQSKDVLKCQQWDMKGTKEAEWDMYMCHDSDWSPNQNSHCW